MQAQNLRLQLIPSGRKGRAAIIMSYLRKHGSAHYEEEVTQIQHALQAAYLAKQAGKGPELITAALLHDIGHIIADDPQERNHPTLKNDLHEEIAASYLRDIFPEAVLQPIRLHVDAKRYLCTTREGYYEKLSEASQKSYHLQGGVMNEKEIAAFEGHTYYREAVLLRTWDDLAKDVTKTVPEIEAYEQELMVAMI